MPNRVTCYHRQHGASTCFEIDARERVLRHPEEWSMSPWPADDGKTHQGKDAGVSDDAKAKAEAAAKKKAEEEAKAKAEAEAKAKAEAAAKKS